MTVAACTLSCSHPSDLKKKNNDAVLRPISSLAHLLPRRCSTTSTKCAMDDPTVRAPSAPSRAGPPSSSCYVPSRYPSFGSRLATGLCHKLLARMNVRARLSTSSRWRHTQALQKRAGCDTWPTQKCVVLLHFKAMGSLSGRYVSRGRRAQSPSSMLVTQLMNSRDEKPLCIG